MLTRGETDPLEADAAWFAEWRARELSRVDAQGLCYADYTGAALPPASLVRVDAERLTGTVLGNPHSDHRPSREASEGLEAARRAILAFLGAPPDAYDVVFTANASAACRLVGEGWPWGRGTPLILADDNHNSVQGLREYASRAGSGVHRVPLGPLLELDDPLAVLRGAARVGSGLFALPAQSNFSGVRHPLALVRDAQALGHAVLLDAAALLHGATLDLGLVQPEFVVLSHYKIAGYPTGLGALVARRDALGRLARPWFAGGTVEWVSVRAGRHRLRAGAEGFEDGTPPFQQVGAVPPGLALVREAGGPRLARHLERLTGMLLDGLAALRHPNGEPMVRCYGPGTTRSRGATVACNLLGPDGCVIPFDAVERAAARAGVAVRGGCFCNPGCAEAAFGWGDEVVEAIDRLADAFTVDALAAERPGTAVGAIRISFGLGSLARDVQRVIGVLEEIAGSRLLQRTTPRSTVERGAAVPQG